MRVLVTGATGFVGCHTVAALVRDGHEVRALVRDRRRLDVALAPFGLGPVECVSGDVTDADVVARAVDGCDAAVHSAAVFTLDRRREAEIRRTNVGGTELVLDAALAAGLDPVVHVSSVSALFRPGAGDTVLRADGDVGTADQPYARSKVDAERAARARQAAGAPVVITYPGGVWGPDDPTRGAQVGAILTYVKRGVVPVTPGGYPLVDVRDVAAVHEAVVAAGRGRGPRRYLVGGELLSTRELFGTISRLTGRRFVPMPVHGGMLRLVGRAVDAVNAVVPVSSPLTHEAMVTLTEAVPSDSSATEADLGVRFRPAEETVGDTLRWYVEQGLLSSRAAGALLD